MIVLPARPEQEQGSGSLAQSITLVEPACSLQSREQVLPPPAGGDAVGLVGGGASFEPAAGGASVGVAVGGVPLGPLPDVQHQSRLSASVAVQVYSIMPSVALSTRHLSQNLPVALTLPQKHGSPSVHFMALQKARTPTMPTVSCSRAPAPLQQLARHATHPHEWIHKELQGASRGVALVPEGAGLLRAG